MPRRNQAELGTLRSPSGLSHGAHCAIRRSKAADPFSRTNLREQAQATRTRARSNASEDRRDWCGRRWRPTEAGRRREPFRHFPAWARRANLTSTNGRTAPESSGSALALRPWRNITLNASQSTSLPKSLWTRSELVTSDTPAHRELTPPHLPMTHPSCLTLGVSRTSTPRGHLASRRRSKLCGSCLPYPGRGALRFRRWH